MIKIFLTVEQGAPTEDIIASILKEKYALEVALDEISLYDFDDAGTIVFKRQSQITFITKALLYTELEEYLFRNWNTTISTFYTVPILNMDKERANLVRKNIKAS